MNFRHGEIFICVLDFSLHPFAEGRRRWIYVSPWNFFFLPPFFFFFPSLSLSSPSFSPSGKKSNPGAMFNRDSSGQISFPVFDGRLTDERALSISRHGFWTWNNLMKRKPLASPTMALCFGEEKKKREKFYGIGIHKGEHVFINR